MHVRNVFWKRARYALYVHSQKHFSYQKMEQGVGKAASIKIALLFVAFTDIYTTWCITCLYVRLSQAHWRVQISPIQRWANVIELEYRRWFASDLHSGVWPQLQFKLLEILLTVKHGVRNANIGASLNAFSESTPFATSVSVSRYPRIPALCLELARDYTQFYGALKGVNKIGKWGALWSS